MSNFDFALLFLLVPLLSLAFFIAMSSEVVEGVAEEGQTQDVVVVGTENVSSHVLDIAVGRPAQGVNCTAYKWVVPQGKWELWGETMTNAQGRIPIVHPGQPLTTGMFKLHFHTGDYFRRQNRDTFFPYIEVSFMITDPNVHYHVPITLSNFGYSTYKGQ